MRTEIPVGDPHLFGQHLFEHRDVERVGGAAGLRGQRRLHVAQHVDDGARAETAAGAAERLVQEGQRVQDLLRRGGRMPRADGVEDGFEVHVDLDERGAVEDARRERVDRHSA